MWNPKNIQRLPGVIVSVFNAIASKRSLDFDSGSYSDWSMITDIPQTDMMSVVDCFDGMLGCPRSYKDSRDNTVQLNSLIL